MQAPPPLSAILAAALWLWPAQAPSAPLPPKEPSMTFVAHGTFEVTLTPLPEAAPKEGWRPARMTLSKQFRGDLDGASQGEMMTAMSEVKGSGAYAAAEKVEGTLKGRRGSFLLQHFGVMTRGVPGEWVVTVVPDSGTGALAGLKGRMTITIEGALHRYRLDYTLEPAP